MERYHLLYCAVSAEVKSKISKMKIENIIFTSDLERPCSLMFRLNMDARILYPIMAELRLIKTDKELEVIRYVCKIASLAHRAMMKAVRVGLHEYQLESVFRHTCYFHGGCRHQAFTCVVASGVNGAILHYGHAAVPNDKRIEDGDMCLCDMGPEYNCYAGDITTTYPANGKYTEKQKMVYNAVLEANRAVFKAAKPGTRWIDMHMLAEKVILIHLKKAGLLIGDIDEMMEARLGAVFMPHGLGHFLGLDVHDVAGYLGASSKLPGLKSLRTTRTLQERMVSDNNRTRLLFYRFMLDDAFNDPKLAKFMVKAEIDKYRGEGGVRIEDDVVIWEKGNENLSDVPRTTEENVAPRSVVLLRGGSDMNRYNTDETGVPFRQESYFFWAFGVHESDFYGAIDVDTGKSCLFPPILDPSYAIWDGKISDESFFKSKYEVDEVHFRAKNTISDHIRRLNIKKVLLLRAENSDSGNILEPPSFPDKELGCNSSILHYGHANAPNDKLIKDGDMCLFDMGPEYNCYASDVTTSFPANGKFSEKQKIVYNAVLEANRAKAGLLTGLLKSFESNSGYHRSWLSNKHNHQLLSR
ncbi:unnamed protein product [Haemonchus placei]|uniref:Xaa-Pro dipeptidase n=1 Tax=Haemonchus placei TaxID=6290 RepID=A0A3P7ZQI9_HAEPC|nr:unnamed protein product [Haemonchus placei]